MCETATTIFVDNGSVCPCKPNVNGVTCNTCKDGYYNLLATNSEGCQGNQAIINNQAIILLFNLS